MSTLLDETITITPETAVDPLDAALCRLSDLVLDGRWTRNVNDKAGQGCMLGLVEVVTSS